MGGDEGGHESSIALCALAAAVLAAPGCGEKSEPAPRSRPPPRRAEQAPPNDATDQESDTGPDGPTKAERRAARLRADQRAVERTVTRYLEALDARDGAEVCATLAPGALQGLKLPRPRGSCAASLDASIGYRDPRGLPEFRGVHLSQVAAIRVGRRPPGRRRASSPRSPTAPSPRSRTI